MTSAGYSQTYEQCREKMKKLRTEYKKISDKRKETGQGRYPEWDYFDTMGDVLVHKPSTQPEVVGDALADSQAQNTQTEDNDDDLQKQDPPQVHLTQLVMLLPVLLLIMMPLKQVAKHQQVLNDRKRVKMGLKKYLAESARGQKEI